MQKIDIRTLSEKKITDWMAENNQPAFRTKQLLQWINKGYGIGFAQMNNLPKELVNKLQENFVLEPLTIFHKAQSNDRTLKYALMLADGKKIEGVIIPTSTRATACISSQVGCSLDCTFCATGLMARERNLEAHEIFEQVALLNQESIEHFGYGLTNVVLMGMGEPLLNYKNVLAGIEMMHNPAGLNLSYKRITLSTSGIAKMIAQLANDRVSFNLALSLHAAIDSKRDKIMSINKTNDLKMLSDALKYFYSETKNEITLEYILFDGFNNLTEDVNALVKFAKQFPCKINIIEFNPVEGVPFKRPSDEGIDNFAKAIADKGVMVSVRRSRGRDIDAACGQLALKIKNLTN